VGKCGEVWRIFVVAECGRGKWSEAEVICFGSQVIKYSPNLLIDIQVRRK
jgi:hypothetical protein